MPNNRKRVSVTALRYLLTHDGLLDNPVERTVSSCTPWSEVAAHSASMENALVISREHRDRARSQSHTGTGVTDPSPVCDCLQTALHCP